MLSTLPDKTDTRDLPPPRLAARCQNDQPDASHEPFCFELFRRAILESCSLCWHYLHNQYYSLVRYWVSCRTSGDDDIIDDLTQETFTDFWRFYTAEKLAQADGLGSVLAYLKSCAASVVAQVHRRAKRLIPEEAWDQRRVDIYICAPSAESVVEQRSDARRIWATVEAHCKDEAERLIARSTFLAGMQPRHIADRFPEVFPDVNDVYRVKRNLLERLRRDPILGKYAEK